MENTSLYIKPTFPLSSLIPSINFLSTRPVTELLGPDVFLYNGSLRYLHLSEGLPLFYSDPTGPFSLIRPSIKNCDFCLAFSPGEGSSPPILYHLKNTCLRRPLLIKNRFLLSLTFLHWPFKIWKCACFWGYIQVHIHILDI